jgi:hypothetical protein
MEWRLSRPHFHGFAVYSCKTGQQFSERVPLVFLCTGVASFEACSGTVYNFILVYKIG